MSEQPNAIKLRFVALCVPFLFAAAIDGTATQLGQSPEYWRGDFTFANEGVTTFNDLLRLHPLAHAAGFLAYALLLCLLILMVPPLLAMVVSFAATIGHAAGAFTWLAYQFRFSMPVSQLMFACVAVVMSVCLTRGWTIEKDRPLLANRPIARWTSIALLIVVPVCLFLLR